MNIVDKNVSLVNFDIDHIETIQLMASKFENTRYTNIPHPYPIDGAAFYQNICKENKELGDSAEYVVACNDAIIGMAGILHIKNKDEVQLGYWLDSAHWNKGIGRIVVKKLLEIGKAIHLKTIYADVLPENQGSSRILEINGFSLEKEHALPDSHHKFPGRIMKRFKNEIEN